MNLTVSNVAEMQCSESLCEGALVRTLGYRSAGDGGGNDYVIISSDKPEDGGSLIYITRGVRAQGIFSSDAINPLQFGAYGDGLNDDSPAIDEMVGYAKKNNRVIDFLGPELIWCPSKEIVVDWDNAVLIGNNPRFSPLNMKKNNGEYYIHLKGEGCIESTRTHVISEGDICRNTTCLTVEDASFFDDGDWLAIHSNEHFVGDNSIPGYHLKSKGEFVQVRFIDGNKIYFDSGTQEEIYRVNEYTLTVVKVEFLKKVKMSGIRLVGHGDGQNSLRKQLRRSLKGVLSYYVQGLLIENCSFENFARRSVETILSMDVVVTQCSFLGRNLKDKTNQGKEQSVWFTGFYFGGQNIIFSNNVGYNLRRLFEADTPDHNGVVTRNATVSNNIAHDCYEALGTHMCRSMSFINNIGYACGGGIQYRGAGGTFLGNRFYITSGCGIRLGRANAVLPTLDDVMIKDNYIAGGAVGIDIAGNCSSVIIENNILEDFRAAGIKLQMASANSFKVSGNVITGRNRGKPSGLIVDGNRSKATRSLCSGHILNNSFSSLWKGVSIAGLVEPYYSGGLNILTIFSGNLFECIEGGDLSFVDQSKEEGGSLQTNFLVVNNSFSHDYHRSIRISEFASFSGFPVFKDNYFDSVFFEYPPIGDLVLDSLKFVGATFDKGAKFNYNNAGQQLVCTDGGTVGEPIETVCTIESNSNLIKVPSGFDFSRGEYLLVRAGEKNVVQCRIVWVHGGGRVLEVDSVFVERSGEATLKRRVPEFKVAGRLHDV